MFMLNNFGQFTGPKGLQTHFYSLIQNSIGPNFGDGLNFVTCEHSLEGWIHRVHSHRSHSQNGTNRVKSFFRKFLKLCIIWPRNGGDRRKGDREPQALADPGGARDPRPLPLGSISFIFIHGFFLPHFV